jgi:hypothetical protein
MRALVLAALTLVTIGCNDPCAGAARDELCVALTVDSTRITTLQQLSVTASVAGGSVEMHTSPSQLMGQYKLPFTIGLIFPGLDGGSDVHLVAEGLANGAFTAQGALDFTLSFAARQRQTLSLDDAPGTLDMAPPSTDMGMLAATPFAIGISFDAVVSSDNVIAAITHADQTLQLYDANGIQLATLDKGVSANALLVTDNLVLYCITFVPIGTTTSQSCTLRLWKPGMMTATTLGSGVYPFTAGFSSDGSIVAWRQNIDKMAMSADVQASISGTVTTLATQLPLTSSWLSVGNGVVYATVQSATAGQFDVARLAAGAAPVRICQGCDQVVIRDDLAEVAARTAIGAGNVGKVVVGDVSINSANGLNTQGTISPSADVTRLVDYFPGQVTYLAGTTLMSYAVGASTTVLDTNLAGLWFTTSDMVATAHLRNSDGSGDLWAVPKTGGAAQRLTNGPGVLWDYTSNDYYTFNQQPAGGAAAAFAQGWTTVAGTPLFTLNAPSHDAVLLDSGRLVCFTEPGTMVYQDIVSGTGFRFNSTIVSFDVDRKKQRLLFAVQNGNSHDGLYEISF